MQTARDIPHLLLSLSGEAATGRLRALREGVTRDLFLSGGWLVHADSSADTDALEWLLFNAGVLTEERLGHVRSLISTGMRRGRALVEVGAVTPAALCDWAERRAGFLAGDTLRWRQAECAFEEGSLPEAGAISVRLDPRVLALAILREATAGAGLSDSLPSADAVPVQAAGSAGAGSALQAHERYVLSLADGRRKVAEICFLSEIGETDTLKALALLDLAGCLQGAAGAPRAARDDEASRDTGTAVLGAPLDIPVGDSPAEIRATIRIYNDVYAGLCAYLIKEVGPIAEQLLEKHLRDARDQHAALFSRALPGRDGALPEDQILRNLNLMRDNRRDALVAGLHDYLKAMVLAVRRILGPEHEARVLRRLKELRCSRT